MNGRVYDPRIGRFVSADPIVQAPGFSQSYNRYAYIFDSPLSFTDPSGYRGDPEGGSGSVGTTAPPSGGFPMPNAITCDEIAPAEICTFGIDAWWSKWDPEGAWVPMRERDSGTQRVAIDDPYQVRDGDPEWMFDLLDLIENRGTAILTKSATQVVLEEAAKALVVNEVDDSKRLRIRIGVQRTILRQNYQEFEYINYVIPNPNDTGAIVGGPRPARPDEPATRSLRMISIPRPNSQQKVLVYDICLLGKCADNVR